MPRAIWNGKVIAESGTTETVEGNVYFPEASLERREYLGPSNTTSTCPWKGQARYLSLLVEGQDNLDAAWYYPAPEPAARKISRGTWLFGAAWKWRCKSLLQNYLQAIDCVRARLQSCRKWPIKIPPLAAAELQITENKTAGAKAQDSFLALPARLKSCPDTSWGLNGILQEARNTGISLFNLTPANAMGCGFAQSTDPISWGKLVSK